jgi:hypothetical protein
MGDVGLALAIIVGRTIWEGNFCAHTRSIFEESEMSFSPHNTLTRTFLVSHKPTSQSGYRFFWSRLDMVCNKQQQQQEEGGLFTWEST